MSKALHTLAAVGALSLAACTGKNPLNNLTPEQTVAVNSLRGQFEDNIQRSLGLAKDAPYAIEIFPGSLSPENYGQGVKEQGTFGWTDPELPWEKQDPKLYFEMENKTDPNDNPSMDLGYWNGQEGDWVFGAYTEVLDRTSGVNNEWDAGAYALDGIDASVSCIPDGTVTHPDGSTVLCSSEFGYEGVSAATRIPVCQEITPEDCQTIFTMLDDLMKERYPAIKAQGYQKLVQ